MGKVKPRRQVERKKTRGAATREDVDISNPARWYNEAAAVLYFALAAFVALSFFSYQSQRGAPEAMSLEPEVHVIRNIMGPAGHFGASMLFGFLGWTGLVVAVWALWKSVYHWTHEWNKSEIALGARAFGLLGLGCVFIFSAMFASSIVAPHIGGTIGRALSTPLVAVFGSVGSACIAGVLVVVALAVALRTTLGTMAVKFGEGSGVLLKSLFITLPDLLLSGVGALLSAMASGFSAFSEVTGLSSILSRGDAEDDDEDDLPKPKRHKNRIPIEDEDEDDATDDDDEDDQDDDLEGLDADEVDDDYSRVVVERRVSDYRVSGNALKKLKAKVDEEFDAEAAWANYQIPDLDLIARGEPTSGNEDDEALRRMSAMIESKLRDFSILGKVTHVHPGPVITLFEFEPAPGVKVGKIAALQDDLAMSLRATSIRIIAPIPRRGTVGIEVPNKNRETVRLRDMLESKAFVEGESTLSVPLGKDTYGDPVVVDIAKMPHLLIAGATGTGKSVCINAVLLSLLYRATPAELGLIMIDPKILELSVYDGIPHLRVPVVTAPRQARAVLEWAVHEMNRRYRLMQRYGVRGIDGFNKVARGEEAPDESDPVKEVISDPGLTEGVAPLEPLGDVDLAAPENPAEGTVVEEIKPLSKIVIVIDELADLMLSSGREIEDLIARLAQKARAAGIHLIVATQRPSVDVVTGLIKANFPARISFRVTTRVDSRTILDSMGAERLLGNGDMLFMSPGAPHLRRVHGAFVTDAEVQKVIKAIKKNGEPHYDQQIIAACERALEEEKGEGDKAGEDLEYDDLYDKAVELVVQKGKASTSLLQRAFRIGYNRAARIIDLMEREGVIGPMDGAKPREVIAPRGGLAGNEE